MAKRNRQEQADMMNRYYERLQGLRRELCPSPRMMATYGRHLPLDVAAPFFLSCERATAFRTRQSWATARIRTAEATRRRVRAI